MKAVNAFLSVTTQWRRTSFGLGGVYTEGLDYGGCRAGFELAGIDVSPELWGDIQIIELGAKTALNED